MTINLAELVERVKGMKHPVDVAYEIFDEIPSLLTLAIEQAEKIEKLHDELITLLNDSRHHSDRIVELASEKKAALAELTTLRAQLEQARRVDETLTMNGITFYPDLADEGTPWESVAEPEPEYFATLQEALDFQFEVREQALRAELEQAKAKL